MRHPLLVTVIALTSVGGIAMTACRNDSPTSPEAMVRSVAHRAAATPSLQLPIEQFSSEVISRGRFIDDVNVQFRLKDNHGTDVVHVNEPSDMVMARITIPANRSLPWHTHPGPAMVTVTSGTLVLVDGETCSARTLDATDPAATKPSFIDRGQGHLHVAYNPGATPTVLTVTYLGVTGPSALVRANNPGC